VWLLAVAWFDFSGGPEVDLNLAVVTGFFVTFFTLFLLAASWSSTIHAGNSQKRASPSFSRTKSPSTGEPCGAGMF